MGGILRYAQDDVNYGLEFFLRLDGGFSSFLV